MSNFNNLNNDLKKKKLISSNCVSIFKSANRVNRAWEVNRVENMKKKNGGNNKIKKDQALEWWHLKGFSQN